MSQLPAERARRKVQGIRSPPDRPAGGHPFRPVESPPRESTERCSSKGARLVFGRCQSSFWGLVSGFTEGTRLVSGALSCRNRSQAIFGWCWEGSLQRCQASFEGVVQGSMLVSEGAFEGAREVSGKFLEKFPGEVAG